MERLTKEEIKECTPLVISSQMGRVYGKTLTRRIMSELLEYKCIEEKLGIDLITFFKALTDGVYVKEYYDHGEPRVGDGDKWFIYRFENEVGCYKKGLSICQFYKRKQNGSFGEEEYCPPEEHKLAIRIYRSRTIYFQDYGKTWFLTKKESENDR